MRFMKIPGSHPQSFRHRIGSRYGNMFDRNFLLGYDPYEDHPLIGMNNHPVNVREDKEYYEIEIPLPGYKKEEIQIHVEDDLLTVKGKKEEDSENQSAYIIKEHGTNTFEQSFRLSGITDRENITARF